MATKDLTTTKVIQFPQGRTARRAVRPRLSKAPLGTLRPPDGVPVAPPTNEFFRGIGEVVEKVIKREMDYHRTVEHAALARQVAEVVQETYNRKLQDFCEAVENAVAEALDQAFESHRREFHRPGTLIEGQPLND